MEVTCFRTKYLFRLLFTARYKPIIADIIKDASALKLFAEHAEILFQLVCECFQHSRATCLQENKATGGSARPARNLGCEPNRYSDDEIRFNASRVWLSLLRTVAVIFVEVAAGDLVLRSGEGLVNFRGNSSQLASLPKQRDSGMDHVLRIADHYVLTLYVYPASWPKDGALRQLISLSLLTNLGAQMVYLIFGTLNFYCVFDHRLMEHPQFIENQVSQEIRLATTSLFWMSFPTVLIFFLEIRGHSKLFDDISQSSQGPSALFMLGWPGVLLSIAGFLFFTDMCIYWIHRSMHHRSIYKYLHKQHHLFKIPTPFASHAFHPLDGFLQSLLYHVYPFIFPLHKVVYLSLFMFVNIWTISIHDGDYRIPGPLISIINGAAHHVDHHLFFNCNYGQYFTLWDRLGGSYRCPSVLQRRGPHWQACSRHSSDTMMEQ